MALTFFWRCESATLDGTHDYTAFGATTPGETVGTPVYDSAAAKYGTNGLNIGTLDQERWSDGDPRDLLTNLEGAIGVWLRWPSTPVNADLMIYARGTTNFDDYVGIEVTGDELRLQTSRNGGSVMNLATTGVNLAANNWYFVKIAWKSSTNYRRIAVWNTSMSLIESVVDSSTDWSASLPTDVFGVRVGDASGTFIGHIDNVFFADTFDEPFENWADIASYTEYGASEEFDTITSVYPLF